MLMILLYEKRACICISQIALNIMVVGRDEYFDVPARLSRTKAPFRLMKISAFK